MKERPGFAEWFKDSVFVDESGTPTVFYHGTDTAAPFNVFARTEESSIGFHFGDLDAAHKRLANVHDAENNWGAIIPVLCNGTNPLRLTDHHTWDQANVCAELYDLGLVNGEQHDLIVDSYNEYAIFAAVELAGYDCIVYTNETEHSGTPRDSLIVWRAEMVKGLYAGRFELDSPCLVPDVAPDHDDMECWESVPSEIDRYRSQLEVLASVPARPSAYA